MSSLSWGMLAMARAGLRKNEAASLVALEALEVLDSAPEADFDALVRAASVVCGVPISLLSLIDVERQWFKANIGLNGVTETTREQAFCAHAVLQDDILEIPDAAVDERFADNPLVTGEPGIRFYAGAPIRLSGGQQVGTLCVIDRQPGQLSVTQREVLRQLSIAAARALEGRAAIRQLREVAVRNEQAALVLEHSADAIIGLTPEGTINRWNPAAERMFGFAPEQIIGRSQRLLVPDSHADLAEQLMSRLPGGSTEAYESVRQDQQGRLLDVAVTLVPERDAAGQVIGAIEFVRDTSIRKQALRRLEISESTQRLIMDNVPSMLAYWNRDLRCRFANRAYQRWFGVDHAAMEGTHIRDVLGAEIFAKNERHIEAVLAGEAQTFERIIPAPDGEIRHALALYLPDVVDGEVVGFLVQITDVTELKNSELALRQSQDFLARTGALAGVGGWEVDLERGRLHWSEQVFRIHGIEPGDSPTVEQAIAFYTPECRPIMQKAVFDAMQGGSGWDLELQIIRGDGALRCVRAVGAVEHVDGRPARLIGAFQDVAERRRLAAELVKQHELLKVTLDSIGDAVVTTDADETVTWLNPVAERMTGWRTEEASGRPLGQVFHIVNARTRLPAEIPAALCMQQERAMGLAHDTVLISRDGSEFGIEDSAAPILNEAGELLGMVLVFHDVTEQRRLSNEMSHRATHDAMTGLVNRAEFEVRLQAVIDRAHQDKSSHALMYIDLDQFKLVNDACGHAAGDRLLQQVARLLQETVRSRDTLARLGGDEFAIILDYCTGEQAGRLAQQLCEKMEDFRFIHGDQRFRVGASIGLVPVDDRWDSTAAVLQAADISCYAAKEAGRNRVHAWFDTDTAMRVRSREMQWAHRLEQALDENRFVLFAQRIFPIALPSEKINAEVLLRLVEPDGTLTLPGAFLPAAERFNLSARIDRWVLRHAIAVLTAMPSLEHVELLHINLSGQSIGDRVFHLQAVDMLQQAGAEVCRRVCLEITETAAITKMADATVFIEQVHDLGCRVALDDFGAGASSFGYLKSLSADMLKIDGQFVKDIVTDPLDDAAVRCFVQVAKVVKMETVAEFVDHPAVLEQLRGMGVDYAQGFLLHRPEPIEAVFKLPRIDHMPLLQAGQRPALGR